MEGNPGSLGIKKRRPIEGLRFREDIGSLSPLFISIIIPVHDIEGFLIHNPICRIYSVFLTGLLQFRV